MHVNERRILVDHYFKRYFDLGRDFHISLLKKDVFSLDRITNAIHLAMPLASAASKASAIYKIHSFIDAAPSFALEVLDSAEYDYDVVIERLDYAYAGSRYEISPSRITANPGAPVHFAPAIAQEASRCYEKAVETYMVRTSSFSLTIAFEAIRKERARLSLST
jgi:hypothetical protein